MKSKNIVLALIIVILVGAGYAWFFLYNKAHTDYQKEEAAYIGHADDFHVEATDDPSIFTETYVNKAVEIEGVVMEVGTSSFKLGNGMICMIDSSFAEFLPELGETVTVKGRVVGTDEDILTAEIICNLDMCVIVSN